MQSEYNTMHGNTFQATTTQHEHGHERENEDEHEHEHKCEHEYEYEHECKSIVTGKQIGRAHV